MDTPESVFACLGHAIMNSMSEGFRRTLRELGSDVEVPLDDLHIPLSLTDTDGIIRWQNRESIELIGDRQGMSYVPVVASDHRQAMQTRLTRFMFGTDGARDDEVEILDKNGLRRMAICSSLPLRSNGQVVAILTIARIAPATERSSAVPDLTPRQRETLRLLAAGYSTQETAERLGVAAETARNHIRAILKRLNVHTRLEAVVAARQLGLLEQSSSEPPTDGGEQLISPAG
jgi:DNA-binding CsgD family transcriptional regulator